MPPYVYVKIIWRITSYSTLFILKRNTGNCFYLLLYECLSGIFLEKVHQKTLFRTMCFRLFTRSLTIFFSGVDIRTAICSQLHLRTESGEELHTSEMHGSSNSWLIEARIIEVLLYLETTLRIQIACTIQATVYEIQRVLLQLSPEFFVFLFANL
jgi:hypothetical protein